MGKRGTLPEENILLLLQHLILFLIIFLFAFPSLEASEKSNMPIFHPIFCLSPSFPMLLAYGRNRWIFFSYSLLLSPSFCLWGQKEAAGMGRRGRRKK